MATFFSGSTDQRGVGGDMSFHHYPPPNPYPASSTGGLIPLPATVASHGHIAQGDAGDEPAFMNTMERPTSSDLLMANCQANSSAVQHQGLSLSLGTQVPVSLYQYRPASMDAALLGAHHPTTVNRNVQGGTSVQNTKYLKAARELLDELVSVRNAEKRKAEKSQSHGTSECKDGDKSDDRASNRLDSTGNSSAELSPSERQDLQNKVTALLTMLDQVERRYRHYHQQMQLVVSSFDAVAGPGAGKPYTTLALRTISRHFRSLRDAIGGQVQATRRSLGEQDASAHGAGIARLRYIDQHMRQQRAMQQFGMVQPPQHAWRPQRGLPESSVSILRAWLFEHFLHPYPKDSEKLMLARQTGLSRGQVSNWFINARVRLWKPMIEDMYKEEFGTEMDSNSSSENAGKEKDEALSSEDPEELKSPSSGIRHGMSQLGSFKSEAIAGLDTAVDSSSLEGSMNAYATSLSLNHHGPNASSNSSLLQDALVHHNGNLRFMAYNNMAGLGGYDGSSVSLTLGLQHCNSAGPVQTEQQGMLYGDASDFEYMNSSEDRQRFGSSSSQLLHDFVT